MRKLVLVPAVLITLLAFGQQSNPPRPRVERTPPPNTPTTQTPTEQPPQTQEPRTARTPQAEQAPATTPSTPARTEPSEGGEGQQLRPMHFDMTEVPPVQTHHSIRVGGRELRYTATAARLPIKDAEGKVEAEMFFVAYTLDGSDPSTRSLTFSFNGGPGSASIWLHMGAIG